MRGDGGFGSAVAVQVGELVLGREGRTAVGNEAAAELGHALFLAQGRRGAGDGHRIGLGEAAILHQVAHGLVGNGLLLRSGGLPLALAVALALSAGAIGIVDVADIGVAVVGVLRPQVAVVVAQVLLEAHDPVGPLRNLGVHMHRIAGRGRRGIVAVVLVQRARRLAGGVRLEHLLVGNILEHAAVGPFLGHAVDEVVALHHEVAADGFRIGCLHGADIVVGLGHLAGIRINGARVIADDGLGLGSHRSLDGLHGLLRGFGHAIAGDDVDGFQPPAQLLQLRLEGGAVGIDEPLQLPTDGLDLLRLLLAQLLIGRLVRQLREHGARRGPEVLDAGQQRGDRGIRARIARVLVRIIAEQRHLTSGDVVQGNLVAHEQRVLRIEHD